MAEDLVFARKASGLVRGLDMWDAFGAGLMTCQPIATLWLMVGIALSLYPTGNLLISIAIGAVTAGIGAPLVWGILSGSMPRAGGEYVYNSRILHPAIALGAVFCNIIAIFYWNWLIATWLGIPAMKLFAQYQGWWGFADWVRFKTGLVVLGLIAVIVGYLLGGLRHEELRADPEDHADPRHRRRDHPDRRAVPLEQGRLHPQLERDRRPVQVAGLRAVHPGRRRRCPTPGTGTAPSAPSAACTRCSSTTTRSPTSAARSSARTRPSWAATSSPSGYRSCWASSLGRASTESWRSTSSAHGAQSFGAGVPGYTAPYTPDYLTLTWIASGKNGIVAWAITARLHRRHLVGDDHRHPHRRAAWLAWGLDRMGPKWFHRP